MRVRVSAVFFIIALSLALPRLALAQGAVAHASVAAAISDSETSPAFGGGVTWMFNRGFGFGVGALAPPVAQLQHSAHLLLLRHLR